MNVWEVVGRVWDVGLEEGGYGGESFGWEGSCVYGFVEGAEEGGEGGRCGKRSNGGGGGLRHVGSLDWIVT